MEIEEEHFDWWEEGGWTFIRGLMDNCIRQKEYLSLSANKVYYYKSSGLYCL